MKNNEKTSALRKPVICIVNGSDISLEPDTLELSFSEQPIDGSPLNMFDFNEYIQNPNGNEIPKFGPGDEVVVSVQQETPVEGVNFRIAGVLFTLQDSVLPAPNFFDEIAFPSPHVLGNYFREFAYFINGDVIDGGLSLIVNPNLEEGTDLLINISIWMTYNDPKNPNVTYNSRIDPQVNITSGG